MNDIMIKQSIRNLHALKGRVVKKVVIYETAFIAEGVDGKPVFTHDQCPFLQAQSLLLVHSENEMTAIKTYKQHDSWGVYSHPSVGSAELGLSFISGSLDGMQRSRELKDFPVGEINTVSIVQNQQLHVSEVTLGVGERSVLLKSGEVIENRDGTVQVLNDDKSILVFLNPQDKDRVAFNDLTR